jgi:Uma2 family endonuclease
MLHLKPKDDDIQYPTSDGEPMGETDLHRQMMVDIIESLRIHYQADPEVYVSGNLLMLYEEGKPNSHVSPDVFIALGVPQGDRENYKIWEEGKAPDLVIEITSKSTRIRDIGFKKGLYEVLGVGDYLLFDPRHEYLKPSFQAYRLEGDSFVRVLVGENCAYTSSSTGLEFRILNGVLRIFSASGEMLLTPSEYATRAREQAALAEQEKARADQEKSRAEQEKARADQERIRADELQRELDELRKRNS